MESLLCEILESLVVYVSIGTLGRLGRVSYSVRSIVYRSEIIAAAIALKPMPSGTPIGRASKALSQRMTSTLRCRECGKRQARRSTSRLEDKHICLSCARDPVGFRAHVTIDAAAHLWYEVTGWMISKRRLALELTPGMLTRTRGYLYCTHQIISKATAA